MKKLYFCLFMVLCSVATLAQDKLPTQAANEQKTEEMTTAQKQFYDIISECHEVIDTKDYTKHQIFRCYIGDDKYEDFKVDYFANILNMDVFRVFGLTGYNTDLKKKMFKESDEYKKYYSALQENKKEITDAKFYYLSKFSGNYDLEKKGFPFTFDDYEDQLPNLPNYFVIHDLCFDYATTRFPKHKIEKRRYFGGTDYFVQQKIYLNVPNEKEALKIENAGANKALMIIFKLDSAFPFSAGFYDNTFLKVKIQSLYIVNTKTEEVLYKVL